MQTIMEILNFFLELDKHLGDFFRNYGTYAYVIIFVIIFAETGFVVTPFLPGDSLLFAAGALAAIAQADIWILLVIIPIAAILGNTVNYFAGYWIGPKIFAKETGKFLNKNNLKKAHEFYEKYGPMAITICRFMPILRTMTPFVAGLGKMNFLTFTFFNVLGGLLWGVGMVLAGYLFGNIDIVKNNFSKVVVLIIVVSLIPIFIAAIKNKMKKA